MANEFKVKNGLIVIGDLTTSGTITINGALAATQSWVTSQAYLTSASLSGYATQSYVTSALAALVDAAPAALDTLNELAAALGDDSSFSTTITNNIGTKVAKSGDTMTGNLTLSYGYPRINLYDTNNDSDYSIINNDGSFIVYDATTSSTRFSIAANGNASFNGTINASNFSGTSSGTNTGDQTTITGNAGSATVLQTARTITIGNTGKTFNGGSNVSWTLSEIGALGATAKAADSELLDGQDSNAFLRLLSAGTEANIDTYNDNGFRTINYTGFSKHLLSWNAGGSAGTIQQEFDYGVASRGWRIRNKTDNSTWTSWGWVVMTTANQGYINGTLLHSNNFTTYAAAASHTHTIANVTNLQTSLDAKAPLDSPSLTGTPVAPTAATATNTTQIATTAFVKAQGYLTSYTETDTLATVTGRGATTTSAITVGTSLSITGPNRTVTMFSSSNYFHVQAYSGSTSGGQLWVGNDNDPGFYVNASQHFFRGLDSSSKMFINGTSGNVGIGTTSPTSKLQIAAGSILIDNNFSYRQKTSSGGDVGLVYIDSSNLMGIYEGKIYITSGGNVGVGTSSPAAKLDILNKILIDIDGTYSSGYGTIGFGGTTNGYNRVFGHTGTSDGLFLAAATGRGISFRVNGGSTDNMFLNSIGNLGIGTTSPSQKLNIEGNILLNLGGTLYLRDTTTYINEGSGLNLVSGAARSINLSAGGSERMRITATGDVGIGITSPNNKLEIRNGGGTTGYSGNDLVFYNANGQSAFYHNPGGYVYWYSNQAITFYPGASRSVTFSTDGSVGIGTSTPAAKLHISSGQIQIGDSSSNFFGIRLSRTNTAVVQDAHLYSPSNNSPSVLYIEGGYYSSEAAGTVTAANSGYAYYERYFGNGAANSYKQLGFINVANGNFTSTNLISSITMLSNGNVGIGTTSPTHKLHVAGPGTFTSTTTSIGSNVGLYLSNGGNASNYNGILFQGVSVSDMYFGRSVGGDDLIIYGAGELVKFKQNGNVGIGITSPGYKLDVNGSVNFTGLNINSINQITGSAYIEPVISSGTWSRTSTTEEWVKIISVSSSPRRIRLLLNAGGDNTDMFDEFMISHSGYNMQTHIHRLPGSRYNVSKVAGIKVINSTAATQEVWVKLYAMSTPPGSFEYKANVAVLSAATVAASSQSAEPTGTTGSSVLLFDTNNRDEYTTMSSAGGYFGGKGYFGGNVGIGTTSPAYKLDVNGGPIRITNGFSEPTSEDGYRLKFADNGGINNDSGIGLSGALGNESLWINKGSANGNIRFMFGTLGEKVTFTSAGNVGIGTTTPSRKLDVAGDMTLTTGGYIYGDSTNPYLNLSQTNGTLLAYGSTSQLYLAGSVTTLSAGNNYLGLITNGGERLRITSSGNVGIGTTSPDNLLTVNGSTRIVTPTQSGLFAYDAPTAGSFIWSLTRSTVTNANDLNINARNGLGIRTGVTSLTNDGHQFYITSGGNVGIGTTNPLEKLHIIGSIDTRTNNSTTNTNTILFNVYNGTPAGDGTTIGTGITWKPLYDGYTKRSAGIMQIAEGNYFRAGLAFYTNGVQNESTDWSERLRISSNGNVGIGTASPAFKTTISADITKSGDINPGTAQLSLEGATTPGKRMILGYDTNSNGFGFIKAGNYGVTWTALSLQPDGGNVGIGTTTPSTKLDVSGVITATGGNSTQWNTAYSWGNHATAGYLTAVSDVWVNTSGDSMTGTLSFAQPVGLAFANGQYIKDNGAGGLIISSGAAVNINGTSVTINSNTAWHAGNDGAGSGLDADTVDGIDSGSFLRSDVSDSFSGTLTMATQRAFVPSNYGHGVYGLYSAERYQHVWSMGAGYNLPADGVSNGNGGSLYGLAWSYNPDYSYVGSNAQSKPGLNHQLLLMMNGITYTALGNGIWTSGTITTTVHGTSANWNTAFGWGNHAGLYLGISSKAVDSELLDGIDSSGFVKQLADTNTPNYQNPSSRRVDPNALNPTNEHYAVTTFGNGSNVTGQLATHFQTGNLYSRGYNSTWSAWRRYWNDIDFTSTNISNWNTAYGWGNHASASYATTSYVTTQINNLINGAPGVLDTLDELAAALGDDANFATTVTNSIAGKVSKSGDVMTGALTIQNGTATWDYMTLEHVGAFARINLGDAENGFLIAHAGTTTATFATNGNLTITGALIETSSIKVKENVKTSEGNLEKVVNLRPVTYNKIGSQTTELGLIAEEVAEVYPEFVQYDENGEPIGVNYSRLTAALIGAVKELTNQVQELNKKING